MANKPVKIACKLLPTISLLLLHSTPQSYNPAMEACADEKMGVSFGTSVRCNASNLPRRTGTRGWYT
jgi:hypothetical protein